MRPRKQTRIYWRNGRAWADFRDFSDVGGGQEPLRPKGERFATKDPDVASRLLTARLEELEAIRARGAEPTLEEYASRHLILMAESGKVRRAWIEATERHLMAALEYFGKDRQLSTITPTDVTEWSRELAKRTTRTGEPIAPGTVRHFLNALSGLYTRAIAETVFEGGNPVAAMPDKPTGGKEEARFLSVPEAALLLEAARTYEAKRSDMAIPFIYEILATFLLTGGRKNEVLGLAPDDVSFDRGVIMFRPNEWRGLKTRGSRRTVPLWPQLREILEPYLDPSSRPPGRLLFPSVRGKGMIHDLRRPLKAIAKRAGLDPGLIHIHAFRHTYTAARLQTLDHGAPVSVFTVSRELGHTSTSLVERVYGHVSGTRHRSEVVEYRVDQHAGIAERVRAIRAMVAAGR